MIIRLVPSRERRGPLPNVIALAAFAILLLDIKPTWSQSDAGTESLFPDSIEAVPAGPQAPSFTRAGTGRLETYTPIGQLTATTRVGTSDTGSDVSPEDRPGIASPDVSDSVFDTATPAASDHVHLPAGLSLGSTSRHQPLYFEESNLERYGTSKYRHLQPIRSGLHFGVTAATLPYRMATQLPGRVYQYEHPFEAGRYGHREKTLPPTDKRGILAQGAAVVGLIFLLP
ncbi:MAG: hypothetical protein EA381_00540 [Planctomycetaceae bacterium]|nr:MAG: hypothetical protein EA381_00540 [Planctomycetaceae bacterium]